MTRSRKSVRTGVTISVEGQPFNKLAASPETEAAKNRAFLREAGIRLDTGIRSGESSLPWATTAPNLFPDLVRPLARSVLGRVDLFATLVAQDADEAPHGVRLPLGGRNDLGQGCTLRVSSSRFTSAFLLARSAFGLVACFLARRALSLRLWNLRRRCVFRFSRAVHFVSP